MAAAACGPAGGAADPGGHSPSGAELRGAASPGTGEQRASPAASSPGPAATTPTPTPPPTAAAVFAKLEPDFTACFVEGKKATPEMTGGKITMHVSVDAQGHTACVIPSDDSGLTQDVEDCIRTRLDRETYDTRAPWTTELPLTVKGGRVTLRPAGGSAAPVLEDVETTGMPDAFGVIESVVPGLQRCFADVDRRGGPNAVYVGARVAKDGSVECALTTSSRPMPAQMRVCAADVLRKARFPEPKTKVGLVSIPIAL